MADMARVIVILALLLLISAVIFGVTRKPANSTSAGETDARTTVPLGELSDDVRKTVETSVLGDEGSEPDVASTQEVMAGTMAGAAPLFNSVGVDHRNRASFTGTAAPESQVYIVRDGKILGTAKTDTSGSWTIDFKVPEVREEFDLHVLVKDSSGHEIMGPQRALVSPAATHGGLPRITLMAAELKTDAVAPEPSGVEPDVGIMVEKISPDAAGSATLVGKADPGASLTATINGTAAGETVVGADGSWSLSVRNTTGKDASGIRLGLSSASGKKLDGADIPFKLAALAPIALPASSKRGTEIRIRRGDSLWRIAKRHYGSGAKWKLIFKANKARIRDPNVIFAGHRLLLPG